MDDNPYQAPQTRLDDPSELPETPLEEVEALPHNERDPTGHLFTGAAERSGLNIDALRFVFDAGIYARDFALDTPQGRLGEAPLCMAVVRFAEELYGNAGLSALRDWGLVSGYDVWRIVETLVQNGLMEPSEDDSGAADFGPLAQIADRRNAGEASDGVQKIESPASPRLRREM
jgi:uncharacterized repeat protein (TIGR04138 family)